MTWMGSERIGRDLPDSPPGPPWVNTCTGDACLVRWSAFILHSQCLEQCLNSFFKRRQRKRTESKATIFP